MTNRFTDKFKIWGLNGCFGVKMWQGLSKNDVIRAYLITILTKSSLNDPADFSKGMMGPCVAKKLQMSTLQFAHRWWAPCKTSFGIFYHFTSLETTAFSLLGTQRLVGS